MKDLSHSQVNQQNNTATCIKYNELSWKKIQNTQLYFFAQRVGVARCMEPMDLSDSRISWPEDNSLYASKNPLVIYSLT